MIGGLIEIALVIGLALVGLYLLFILCCVVIAACLSMHKKWKSTRG